MESGYPHGWAVVGGALERTFAFASFPGAIAFVNRVAEAAEAGNHHPDIEIRYRQVTLRLRTHSRDAITELDVALARRADELAG